MEEFRVSNLTIEPAGLLDDFEQFAGRLEVSAQHSLEYFFWLILPKQSPKSKLSEDRPESLTIFINGGPGCSSLDGLFLEVGPFRFKTGRQFELNKNGWHQDTNLLFIDQPLGTGFSKFAGKNDDIEESMEKLTEWFVTFIEKFTMIFQQFRDVDLFITGESYAGQYIPYFSRALHGKGYKVKGILIGSGLFDGKVQDQKLPDYVKKKMGYLLEHSSFQDTFDSYVEICKEPSEECSRFRDDVKKLTTRQHKEQLCLNVFNILNYDKDCGLHWPYELKNLTEFLNDPGTISALNLPIDARWKECDLAIAAKFRRQHSPPSSTFLYELTSLFPVYVFAGDNDFTCNYMGIEHVLGFGSNSTRHDWIYNSKTVGYSYRNQGFKYFLIFNASHMAPYDQGDKVYEVFREFIGKPSGHSEFLSPADILAPASLVYFLAFFLVGAAIIFIYYFMREYEDHDRDLDFKDQLSGRRKRSGGSMFRSPPSSRRKSLFETVARANLYSPVEMDTLQPRIDQNVRRAKRLGKMKANVEHLDV
ncbi:hypothetical protein MP638_000909 [Amoeboaphelidium occidentale]|nr:hypothetical protein MP638_000909 [Amoeboaphelidium occidentale]